MVNFTTDHFRVFLVLSGKETMTLSIPEVGSVNHNITSYHPDPNNVTFVAVLSKTGLSLSSFVSLTGSVILFDFHFSSTAMIWIVTSGTSPTAVRLTNLVSSMLREL